MIYELTPHLTAPVLIGIAVFHVALLILSWRFNSLYLLAGAFMVLAIVSTGEGFPAYVVAKYARVYCSFLLVLIGILRFRMGPLRPTAKALVAVTLVYLAAGLWSAAPIWALAVKSFFFWAVLAGLILAYDLRSRDEFVRGLRFLAAVAGIGGLIIVAVAVANPAFALIGGRLALGGTIANTIGANIAVGLLICSYLALHDRSNAWRIYAFSTAAVLAVMIAWTGSRTALVTAVVGLLVQVVPAAKRRVATFFLIITVVAAPYYTLEWLGGGAGLARITTTVNTRAGVWRDALALVAEAPIIGHGWLPSGAIRPAGIRGFNAHNSFFQAFMDTGVLGLIVFIVCSLVVIVRAYQMVKSMRQYSNQPHQATLPLSLLIAISTGAMASSSTVMGVVSGALFLGFAVGLIDRLPELTISEKRLALLRLLYQRRLGRLWGSWGLAGPASPKS